MTKAIEKKPAGRIDAGASAPRGASGAAMSETRAAAARAGRAIDANPLALLAGGIAIGLVAGALIPKTRRETELLGSVGKRMTDTAANAAEAAREAAKAELGSLPLNREALRAQASKVLDQVTKAISSAGEAALKSGEDLARPAPKAAKKSK